MCRRDGMVFDDGVTIRLAEDRFLMTTTTGNAATVLDWIEEWLQTEWPELRVRLTSVTEQWATVAVVGPRSRDVLARGRARPGRRRRGVPVHDLARRGGGGDRRAGLPRLASPASSPTRSTCRPGTGLALWEAVLAAGAPLGITPYGTETMHVLRAEKGYPIVGQETDGTVTPHDLGHGLDRVEARSRVRRQPLARAGPTRSAPDRKQLVALLPADPDELLPEGAQLVAADARRRRRRCR